MSANALQAPASIASLPIARTALHRRRVLALVVGASTGGPQALDILLRDLAPILPLAPVFVVLHMPPEFMTIVADHTAKAIGFPAKIAEDGEPVRVGHVYFAAGEKHMRLERRDANVHIALGDDPPENFCRPAVDVLFRSAAQCYGKHLLGVVLTGMGSDGLAGSRTIVEAGGGLIVQDARTSVVWGMPGCIAGAGLAEAVLPIGSIGRTVCNLDPRLDKEAARS